MSIFARITSSVTLLYFATSSCRAFSPSPVVPVSSSCLRTINSIDALVSPLVEKVWCADLDLPLHKLRLLVRVLVIILYATHIACFCSYRMLRVSMPLSYEQRTTRTPLKRGHSTSTPLRYLYLNLAHHQPSSAEQSKSIIQHTGLGSPINVIFLSSVFETLLLQAHLTVAFACLKSYRLFLHQISRVIRKRAYERTPAKSRYTPHAI